MVQDKLQSIADSMMLFFPFFHKVLMSGKNDDCTPVNFANPQYPILGMLIHSGQLPISEIGKRLFISKPHMTTIIDKLIEAGNVERRPDENDRRIINIAVTDAGRKFMGESQDALKEIIKKNLSVLGKDEVEIVYNALESMKMVFSKIVPDDKTCKCEGRCG